MKKLLLSIFLTLLPILASAETVEIDGIYYKLVSKAQEAEVKGCNCSGDIEIPASFTNNDIIYSVTSIGSHAFYWRGDVTSITIPNSVTSIAEKAFQDCWGLSSIYIPNSVTSIGVGAFQGCSSLVSITIPNKLTSIMSDTFNGCGLISVNIPNSVTFIGVYAFYQCTKLTSITIPNSVTSIDDYAFVGCKSLSSLTISNSTTIGINAFEGCSSLTSITIPNNLASIKSETFRGCGLTSVTIPLSVTSIGFSAFQDCNSLTSVTIESGVKYIDNRAFANCDELTDVYCLAEEPSESWNSKAFYTAEDAFMDSYPQAMTLHVPAASIDAYRSTTPWSNFKAIVPLEAGETPVFQKCATPEIGYENGKVKFTCETEGVDFISEVTVGDAKKYYDSEFTLSQKYKISVYATKTGYYNSETTTREIEIKGDNKPIIVGDVDGDGKVNVADHVRLSNIIMNE